MKVSAEAGVLPRSERFFSTPSAAARRAFLYLTRCGHYYCDAHYDFQDTSPVGQQESHRNFFLLLVRRGEIVLTADGVRGTAGAGQCALLDCRESHRFTAQGEAETLWVHFDGCGARELYTEILAKNGGKHVLSLPGGNRLERELARLVSGFQSGAPLREVENSQLLYGILCALLFPETPEGGEDSPIARAMAYIGAHLFEALSVAQVAAAVHLSPSHFSREFRAGTGFSPHEYVVLHRIDEAKALLHGSRLSVGEIAYRVGYHSEVNFIASFRSKTGVSPTQFRKHPL